MKHILLGNLNIYIPFSKASISSSIIIQGKKNILLDCGDGTLIFYIKKKLSFPNYIIISHEHADHVGGLFSLLAYMKIKNQKTTIFYPPNSFIVKDIEAIFLKRYNEPFHKFLTFEENKKYSISNSVFIPHKAKHSSFSYPIESFCFELTIENNTIFYSGDTAYFPELTNYIKDKDLALIEASYRKENEHLKKIHLSEKEAKNLGVLAKDYVLIHRRL